MDLFLFDILYWHLHFFYLLILILTFIFFFFVADPVITHHPECDKKIYQDWLKKIFDNLTPFIFVFFICKFEILLMFIEKSSSFIGILVRLAVKIWFACAATYFFLNIYTKGCPIVATHLKKLYVFRNILFY